MRKHNTTKMIILTAIITVFLLIKGIYTENNDYFVAPFAMLIITIFFSVVNGTKKHYLSK